MSRQLSIDAFDQVTNEVSDIPLLTLLRLDTGSEIVYLANNTEEVVSNGNTYIPFYFELVLPKDDGESKSSAQIQFDNVSLDLIDEIRSTTTPLACEIDIVLASNPDFIEISLRDLLIRNIKYDRFKINADLIVDDLLNSKFPADTYNPQEFPGMFN